MDDFIKKMDEAMGHLCNYDRMLDTKRRDYGCGIEMSVREIHALEIIGNYSELNATELAELAGLQKGTFSKLVRRFEQWNLVERFQNAENRKEVFFSLDAAGTAGLRRPLPVSRADQRQLLCLLPPLH